MKKFIQYALSILLPTIIIVTGVQAQTIQQLPLWVSTTSPSSAITQQIFGKPVKLTGSGLDCTALTNGGKLTLDSNNLIVCEDDLGGGGASYWLYDATSDTLYPATTTTNLGVGTSYATSSVTITDLNIAETASDANGLLLDNPTPADGTNDQFSPPIRQCGQGWPASVGVSQTDCIKWELQPIAGGLNSSSVYNLYTKIGSAAYQLRMAVESSGDVGIATGTPNARLHVVNTGSGNTFLAEDSTSPDTSPFQIDASGNTTIGTTTSSSAHFGVQGAGTNDIARIYDSTGARRSWFDSSGRLNLTGNDAIYWTDSGGTPRRSMFYSPPSAGNGFYIGDPDAAFGSGTQVKFFHGSGGSTQFFTGATEKARIESTGAIKSWTGATTNDYVSVGGTSNNVIESSANALGKSYQLIGDTTGGGGAAEFRQGSGSLISWRSTTRSDSGSNDTGLSRGAAGKVYVGNGTAGNDTGTLNAAAVGIQASSTMLSNANFQVGSTTAAKYWMIDKNTGNMGFGTSTPFKHFSMMNATIDTRFTADVTQNNAVIDFGGSANTTFNMYNNNPAGNNKFNFIRSGTTIGSFGINSAGPFLSGGNSVTMTLGVANSATLAFSNGGNSVITFSNNGREAFRVGALNSMLGVGMTPDNNAMLDVGTPSWLSNSPRTTAFYTGEFTNTATSTTANISKRGISVSSTGTWSGTNATSTAIYIGTVTGGTINRAIESDSTASSSFANGINLTGGCFSVRDVCVSGGASLSGGSTNSLTYWTSPTTVGATSSPTVGSIIATSTTETSVFLGTLSQGSSTPSSLVSFSVGSSTATTLTQNKLSGFWAIGSSTPDDYHFTVAGRSYFTAGPTSGKEVWLGSSLAMPVSADQCSGMFRQGLTPAEWLTGVGCGDKAFISEDSFGNYVDLLNYDSGRALKAKYGGVSVELAGPSGPIYSDGTATSSLAGGVDISGGCYAIGGVCVGGSSLSGGSAGSLTYWTGASTVGATTSPTVGYITATSTTDTSTLLGNLSVGDTTANNITLQGGDMDFQGGYTNVGTGMSIAHSGNYHFIYKGQSGAWGTGNSTQFIFGNGDGFDGSNPGLSMYDYANGGTLQVGGALSYGGYNGGTIRTDSTGVGFWDANTLSLSDVSRIKLLIQSGNVTITQTNGGTGGLVTPKITNSGLTSGRVTYASTGGLMTDSANLTFSGSNLLVNGIASSTSIITGVGTVGAPAITFGDTDTGLYTTGVNSFRMAANGADALGISNSFITGYLDIISNGSNSYKLEVDTGSATTPTYSSSNDANSGMWLPGSDTLRLTTGGTDRMSIESDGDVSFNTAAATTTFATDVVFSRTAKLKGYTVATLQACTAGGTGNMAYVTDALAPTYLTAVTGGGAVVAPVFCNGTAWVTH